MGQNPRFWPFVFGMVLAMFRGTGCEGSMEMETDERKQTQSGEVILAPEGFLDEKMLPALKDGDVRVIAVRVLSDGPFFHTVFFILSLSK